MAEIPVLVVFAVVLLIGVVGYFVVRGRQPAPPKQAHEAEQHDAQPRDGDSDPIPRDADGMPLADVADDPADRSVDDMQRRAREPEGGPRP